MRWTPTAQLTSALEADGEVVWFLRPDAGGKSPGSQHSLGMTVAKKPGAPRRARISRNPSRRESRSASAGPVCSCAHLLHYCTRDRGCSVHPAFPAPLSDERAERIAKARAKHVARMRRCVHWSLQATGRQEGPTTRLARSKDRSILAAMANFEMARPTRFERVTFAFGGQRSI